VPVSACRRMLGEVRSTPSNFMISNELLLFVFIGLRRYFTGSMRLDAANSV
jgi:hypothetical protein